MLAVLPPEYWPRPAYLALAAAAGRLVVADTLQYSRQSYQNRARLRTPDGWQWISVPLRGGQHGRPARTVEIENRTPWLRKHARSFVYNYRTAPYYDFYEPRLAPVLETSWAHLGALTARTVELCVALLELDVEVVRASALPGAPADVPAILAAAGADARLVPADHPPAEDGVPERRFRHAMPPYRQNFDGWVPGLSALDVLFNHGPAARGLILAAGAVEG